jgi:hypothetical protein
MRRRPRPATRPRAAPWELRCAAARLGKQQPRPLNWRADSAGRRAGSFVTQLSHLRSAPGYYTCDYASGVRICTGPVCPTPCDFISTIRVECSDGSSGEISAQPGYTGNAIDWVTSTAPAGGCGCGAGPARRPTPPAAAASAGPMRPAPLPSTAAGTRWPAHHVLPAFPLSPPRRLRRCQGQRRHLPGRLPADRPCGAPPLAQSAPPCPIPAATAPAAGAGARLLLCCSGGGCTSAAPCCPPASHPRHCHHRRPQISCPVGMLIGGVSAASHAYPNGSLCNLQQFCVSAPGGARPACCCRWLCTRATRAAAAAAAAAAGPPPPLTSAPLPAGSASVCSLVIHPTTPTVADHMNLAEVELYGSDGAQLPRSAPPAAGGRCAACSAAWWRRCCSSGRWWMCGSGRARAASAAGLGGGCAGGRGSSEAAAPAPGPAAPSSTRPGRLLGCPSPPAPLHHLLSRESLTFEASTVYDENGFFHVPSECNDGAPGCGVQRRQAARLADTLR